MNSKDKRSKIALKHKEPEYWKFEVFHCGKFPSDEPHTCEYCDKKETEYWIEELALGICKDCHQELRDEQSDKGHLLEGLLEALTPDEERTKLKKDNKDLYNELKSVYSNYEDLRVIDRKKTNQISSQRRTIKTYKTSLMFMTGVFILGFLSMTLMVMLG